jgi:FkbM family methyltransferase
MLKKTVKNLLKSAGYKFYKTRYLPFGCDLVADLKRLSPDLEIKTVFDVGANLGQSALDYREKFPKARIYSFEPVSQTFDRLEFATKADPNIFCYQLALAERDGQEEILTRGTSGTNSLKAKFYASPDKDQNLEICQLRRLDSFLETNEIELDKIDFLKIDTEGYEIPVLQGADSLLRAGKILYIFIEVSFRDNDKTHTNFFDIHEFLKPYRFNVVGFYDINPYWGGRNAIDYGNALFKFWRKSSM